MAAQHPLLLRRYGRNRPPFTVAGVDYAIGIPAGTVLTDWRALSDAALSVDTSTGIINTLNDFSFSKVDFSLGVGGTILNQPGGAVNITCDRCNFALPASPQNMQPAFISENNGALLTLTRCKFDNLNGGGLSSGALFNILGSIDMERCWCLNMGNSVASCDSTVPFSVTYKYNFLDNGHIFFGDHYNYLQFVSSGDCTIDIEFNASYQNSTRMDTSPGEGFQFYTNLNLGGSPSLNMPNPIFKNNVMIARPVADNGFGGTNTMSALIHGNGGTGAGTVVGSGTNAHNYFDGSGAAQIWYSGTMRAADGWLSTANIDMNTGLVIVPA